jgi:hypothetical protein
LGRNAHKFSPSVSAPGSIRVASAKGQISLSEAGQAGVDPVARLQANISGAFKTTEDRWSPLSTSVFLLAVCGTFWALVAALVLGRLH